MNKSRTAAPAAFLARSRRVGAVQRGELPFAGGRTDCASRHLLQVSQGQVCGDDGEFGGRSLFMVTSRALNERDPLSADRFTFTTRGT